MANFQGLLCGNFVADVLNAATSTRNRLFSDTQEMNRNDAIRYMKGHSVFTDKEIGKFFGVSGSRVNQVLNERDK